MFLNEVEQTEYIQLSVSVSNEKRNIMIFSEQIADFYKRIKNSTILYLFYGIKLLRS